MERLLETLDMAARDWAQKSYVRGAAVLSLSTSDEDLRIAQNEEQAAVTAYFDALVQVRMALGVKI